MLRTIAISFAQAAAIVLCAEFCWSLIDYFTDNYSFTLGPLVILAVYPMPSFVASVRKHNASLDIIIANLWLGWTVIGWIVALIWACDWDVEAVFE